MCIITRARRPLDRFRLRTKGVNATRAAATVIYIDRLWKRYVLTLLGR